MTEVCSECDGRGRYYSGAMIADLSFAVWLKAREAAPKPVLLLHPKVYEQLVTMLGEETRDWPFSTQVRVHVSELVPLWIECLKCKDGS